MSFLFIELRLIQLVYGFIGIQSSKDYQKSKTLKGETKAKPLNDSWNQLTQQNLFLYKLLSDFSDNLRFIFDSQAFRYYPHLTDSPVLT